MYYKFLFLANFGIIPLANSINEREADSRLKAVIIVGLLLAFVGLFLLVPNNAVMRAQIWGFLKWVVLIGFPGFINVVLSLLGAALVFLGPFFAGYYARKGIRHLDEWSLPMLDIGAIHWVMGFLASGVCGLLVLLIGPAMLSIEGFFFREAIQAVFFWNGTYEVVPLWWGIYGSVGFFLLYWGSGVAWDRVLYL